MKTVSKLWVKWEKKTNMVHAKTFKVKCVLWKEKQNGVISILFSQSVKYVAAMFLLLCPSIYFCLFLSGIYGSSYQEQFQLNYKWRETISFINKGIDIKSYANSAIRKTFKKKFSHSRNIYRRRVDG